MNRKSEKSFVSTGTTSIVLIFVLLCLLTFAVLSLVSAKANLRLSEKSADRTTDYYDAENRANDILLEIDQKIKESLKSEVPPSSSQEFYDTIRKELASTEGISFPEENSLEYQVPLGEDQVLHVKLLLSLEELSGGKHYKILAWDVQSCYDWDPDGEVQLMDMDSFAEE